MLSQLLGFQDLQQQQGSDQQQEMQYGGDLIGLAGLLIASGTPAREAFPAAAQIAHQQQKNDLEAFQYQQRQQQMMMVAEILQNGGGLKELLAAGIPLQDAAAVAQAAEPHRSTDQLGRIQTFPKIGFGDQTNNQSPVIHPAINPLTDVNQPSSQAPKFKSPYEEKLRLEQDIKEEEANKELYKTTENLIKDINTAEEYLDRFETGFGRELKLSAAKVADWIGIGSLGEDIAAGENLKTIFAEGIIPKVKQLPGALSEKELKFLERTANTLGDTTKGNRERLSITRALVNKTEKYLELKNQYYQQNGTYTGFEKYWHDYAKKNELDKIVKVPRERDSSFEESSPFERNKKGLEDYIRYLEAKKRGE